MINPAGSIIRYQRVPFEDPTTDSLI